MAHAQPRWLKRNAWQKNCCSRLWTLRCLQPLCVSYNVFGVCFRVALFWRHDQMWGRNWFAAAGPDVQLDIGHLYLFFLNFQTLDLKHTAFVKIAWPGLSRTFSWGDDGELEEFSNPIPLQSWPGQLFDPVQKLPQQSFVAAGSPAIITKPRIIGNSWHFFVEDLLQIRSITYIQLTFACRWIWPQQSPDLFAEDAPEGGSQRIPMLPTCERIRFHWRRKPASIWWLRGFPAGITFQPQQLCFVQIFLFHTVGHNFRRCKTASSMAKFSSQMPQKTLVKIAPNEIQQKCFRLFMFTWNRLRLCAEHVESPSGRLGLLTGRSRHPAGRRADAILLRHPDAGRDATERTFGFVSWPPVRYL